MANPRIVNCKKLGREAEGLSKPPFPGDLGEQIFQSISKEAWGLWEDDYMIKVINEYRLNLVEEEQYQILIKQMQAFLNLNDDQPLEVENSARGEGTDS